MNVVVLPALDSTSKEEPLFHLEGGPGVAATGAADFYAKEGKEYRRHRDVVLVDQRGTGKSNPLAAPARTKSPQDYLTEMYPVEYVKNLRQALEQRADLTQYTTSIAVDDLDDVRAWLGYDRINLFGLSSEDITLNFDRDFMNMSYQCDDIDKTYKELSARGVQFEGPPQKQPWGTYAMFKDSEGNRFVVSA